MISQRLRDIEDIEKVFDETINRQLIDKNVSTALISGFGTTVIGSPLRTAYPNTIWSALSMVLIAVVAIWSFLHTRKQALKDNKYPKNPT